MKRRKIWAGLGTAVLAAAPAASQAAILQAQPRLEIGSRSEQDLLQLAQHKGHGGEAAKSKPPAAMGGEGDEGGAGGAKLEPSLHLYRGVELIRGHLLVGGELVETGRWAEALPHFLHPEEEIYGSLRDDLKTFGVAPFQVALKSLSQAVKAKNKEAYVRARAALDERLAAAESAVRAKEANGTYFTLETALEVLQQAADEYGHAIEKGRIANVVEYQDARGFVLEVDRLVGTAMNDVAAKNADAAKVIRASLDELKSIFPSVTPPQQPVKDTGQFLSSVARFELQLGSLR
ncbi:hypothetical protein [Microvirga sp. 2TAF3]|uniref:hypothetical protein n=1 Tax=Microvirga sp. 2TAF3 TaxID=3233014 RepID=UPI003F9C1EBD